MSEEIINNVKDNLEYEDLKKALFSACRPQKYDPNYSEEAKPSSEQQVTSSYHALKALVEKINHFNHTGYTISSPEIIALLDEILKDDEEVSWFYHDEICNIFSICENLNEAINNQGEDASFSILNTFHNIFGRHEKYTVIFEEVTNESFDNILTRVRTAATDIVQNNFCQKAVSQLETNMDSSEKEQLIVLHKFIQTISQKCNNLKTNTIKALVQTLFLEKEKSDKYLPLIRKIDSLKTVIALYNDANTSVVPLCKKYDELRHEFYDRSSLDDILQNLYHINSDDIEDKIENKFQRSGLTEALNKLTTALQHLEFNSSKIMNALSIFREKLAKLVEDSQITKNSFADHELMKPIIDSLAKHSKIQVTKDKATELVSLVNGISCYYGYAYNKNRDHAQYLSQHDYLLTHGKLTTDILNTCFYVEDNTEEKTIFDFDIEQNNYLPMQEFVNIDISVTSTIQDKEKQFAFKSHISHLCYQLKNGSILDIIFELNTFNQNLTDKLEENEQQQLLETLQKNCSILVNLDKAREIYAGLCSYTADEADDTQVFFNEMQSLIKNIVKFENDQNEIKSINDQEVFFKNNTNENSAILDNFNLINQTKTYYQQEDNLIKWVVDACKTLSYYFIRYGEREMLGHDQHAVVEFMLLKMISVTLTKELSSIEKYKAIIDTLTNIQAEKGFVFNAINQILSEVKEIKNIIKDPNSPTFIALKTNNKETAQSHETILQQIADTPTIASLYTRYHWVKDNHEDHPYNSDYELMNTKDDYDQKASQLTINPLDISLSDYRKKILHSFNLPSILSNLGMVSTSLIKLCDIFTRTFRRLKYNCKLSNNVIKQLEIWGFTANGKNQLPNKSKELLVGASAIEPDIITCTLKAAPAVAA